ncbi:MAG: YceI family protein [Janthinobacterium lividum]
MKPTFLNRAVTVTVLTGGATAAVAAVMLFNPGPAFTAPRLLGSTTLKASLPVAGNYTIDPMHTSIGFEIQHMGLSKIQGRFDDKSGKIVADPSDLSKSSVSFTALVASIDTNVAPRDADLKSDAFFDAAKYPTLTFQSTTVRKSGNHYVADGTLTIKDQSHPISIPFRYLGPVQDPFGGTRLGILADPITISRRDYGITWDHKMPDGSPQLADNVTVLLSAEATKDK